MRLAYVDPESPNSLSTEREKAIVERIQQRRAPRPLQPLDLTLLHSPDVADGWNSFIGAIRTKTSLREDLKEISISRVAVRNGAWYEWGHHAPLAEKAGVPTKGIDTLKLIPLPAFHHDTGLTEEQLAVAAFTDAMTVNVSVPDEVFNSLKGFLTDKEIVDLTVTVNVSQMMCL